MLRSFLPLLFFFLVSLHAHEPVDIVYTWVDGSDPVWKHEMEKMSGSHRHGPDAISTQRFRNQDELKYSLRSIHQFAPWVNHIYIVTYNQRPTWLKDTPKITIIDHQDIFPIKSHLPSFNSMAIESNIHRIPGLQEYYLYFNDDVFLGKPVSFSDFFTDTGKIKVFLSRAKMPKGKPKPNDTGFEAACKNTSQLLKKIIGKEKRYNHAHTPYPERKSVVTIIEKQFHDLFESVSSHQFRSHRDYMITNGLIPYIALQQSSAEIATFDHTTVRFGKKLTKDKRKLQKIADQNPTFFCIEDAFENESSEFPDELSDFFASYFPTPAPWEKEETPITAEEIKESSAHTALDTASKK